MTNRAPSSDDLPQIVAAIVALLASVEEHIHEGEGENWRASGRVAPNWCEFRDASWRDWERRRGWRHGC